MIRTIQPGDAPAIREICETALGHPASVELLTKRISELSGDPHYYLSVYEDNDKQVKGFLHAEKYELLYGGRGWNIIALAILPDSQGQGFGGQLLSSFEVHCRACGSGFIRLNTRMERKGAHLFYERLGYTCDKVQKRFIKQIKSDGTVCPPEERSRLRISGSAPKS